MWRTLCKSGGVKRCFSFLTSLRCTHTTWLLSPRLRWVCLFLHRHLPKTTLFLALLCWLLHRKQLTFRKESCIYLDHWVFWGVRLMLCMAEPQQPIFVESSSAWEVFRRAGPKPPFLLLPLEPQTPHLFKDWRSQCLLSQLKSPRSRCLTKATEQHHRCPGNYHLHHQIQLG